MSKKTKEIALQTIVLSMEEIRDNFAKYASQEDVTANAKAMLILADAFRAIAGSR